jgi:hypothetical protein
LSVHRIGASKGIPVNFPFVNDDFRLTVALQQEDEANELLESLHELQLEGRGAFDERVIVSHEGPNVFLYADSEERLEHARELVDARLSELGLGAMMLFTRWHPIEQRWEDADLPLPITAEAREAERRVRLERETRESESRGAAEWEVRVELPSHHETVALAERLESDGLAVVRRWRFLLVGAANEDEARSLARRLEAEAPPGATVHVEPGGEMAWEVAPQNPFVIFGGLGL